MSNFKNAKEFDRDPLRKSDIYKTLLPTSGKSLGERWKGRRQSENVTVLPADPIARIIKAEERVMKQEPSLPKDGPSAEKKPRVKKTSSTNPNSKSGRLNSQVTPGTWITK